MNKRWLTSDLHFEHKNILAYCPETRPYQSLEDMNMDIVNTMNEYIKPDDTLFVLGDVCLGGVKNLHWMEKVNGNKHLIIGNHDYVRSNMEEYLRVFKTVEGYREFGHHMSICSHYPVHPQQLGSRYAVNIHGHLHDTIIPDVRYINVCWDHNRRPVEWSEIVDYYESVVKKTKKDKWDNGTVFKASMEQLI